MKFRYYDLIILAVLGLSSCTLLGGGGVPTSWPTLDDFHTPIAATPTLVEVAQDTATPEKTEELLPVPTQTIPPSSTPTSIPTPTPHYVLQPGTPQGTANFAQPELSCYWMGVGGQVFGPDGAPVAGLFVEAGGTLAGGEITQLAITGNTPVFGPGGYLIVLADIPIASDGTLWLQLYDSAGEPQSNKIYLTTYSECERNLLLVNFSESVTISDVQVRLPIIIK